MMRRAQAAMEFLMTYGWAILVVLAAIGALAYFGVLSPDRFLPDKCTVTGGFSCSDYAIDSSYGAATEGQVRLYLQNNLGVDANWVNVTLTSSDCTSITPTSIQVDSASAEVGNGDIWSYNFTCVGLPSVNKFDGDVDIRYLSATGQEAHTAGGSLQGNVN